MRTLRLSGLSNDNCSSNGCVVRTGGSTGTNPIKWGQSDSGESADGNTRIQKTGKFYNGLPVFRYWRRNPDGSVYHEDKAYCRDCPPATQNIPITPAEYIIQKREFIEKLRPSEFFSEDTPPEIPSDPPPTFDRYLTDDGWLCTSRADTRCNEDITRHSQECTDKRNWYRLNGACTNDLLYPLRYVKRSGGGSAYTLFDVAYQDLVTPFFDKYQCGQITVQSPKTQMLNLERDTKTTVRLYVPWVDSDIQMWRRGETRYCFNSDVIFFYLGEHPASEPNEIQWTPAAMLSRMTSQPNFFSEIVKVSDVVGVNTCAMPLGTMENYQKNYALNTANWTPERLCPLPRDRFQELSNDSPLGAKRLTGYEEATSRLIYNPDAIRETLRYLQWDIDRNKQCDNDFTGELCVPFEHLQVQLSLCTGLPTGLHYVAIAMFNANGRICQPSLLKIRVYDRAEGEMGCGFGSQGRRPGTTNDPTRKYINYGNTITLTPETILPADLKPNKPAEPCIELLRKRTCEEYNATFR